MNSLILIPIYIGHQGYIYGNCRLIVKKGEDFSFAEIDEIRGHSGVCKGIDEVVDFKFNQNNRVGVGMKIKIPSNRYSVDIYEWQVYIPGGKINTAMLKQPVMSYLRRIGMAIQNQSIN